MKTILLSVFIFYFNAVSTAQSTWIQRLSWNVYVGTIHNDSVCGIYDAAPSLDGNIFLITKDDLDNHARLLKMDMNNHQEIWSVNAGFWSSMNVFRTSFVKPTPDSGCIIAFNHYVYADYEESEIRKYSGGGLLEWTHYMGGTPVNNSWTNDIVPNASGNYYVLTTDHLWTAPDSLLELDASGSLVFSTTAVHGEKLFEIAPNDLLVYIKNYSGDSIVRTDLAGNMPWVVQETFDYDNLAAFSATAAFFCRSDTSLSISVIKKIDAVNGTVLWTDTIPFSYISAIDPTADGGVVISVGKRPDYYFSGGPAAMNGALVKIDSSGNVNWTKTYLFPVYGLSAIKEYSPGKYITGATWHSCEYFMGMETVSAFVATLDSSGNGVLDSVSGIWNGDANDNDTLETGDYLFIAIASGASGPARDTLPGMFGFSSYPWAYKNYAIDWSQSFGNGVNYKHADVNGDGIINNMDLAAVIPVWYFWISSPLPCRSIQNNSSQLSTAPDFILQPEKDSVAPGEIMRFYIVAGSASMPVDSIIGISFVNDFDFYLTDTAFVSTTFYNSDLGNPSTNLFTASWHYPGQTLSVLCRTDHINAVQLYDTLGVIELKANSTITSPQLFNLQASSFSALTGSTAPVLFNTLSSQVVIDPALVSVEENNSAGKVIILPNPAREQFTVSGICPPVNLKIYDVFGHELVSEQVTAASRKLDTQNWINGIYYLEISSVKKVENFKLVINH